MISDVQFFLFCIFLQFNINILCVKSRLHLLFIIYVNLVFIELSIDIFIYLFL